MVDKETSRSVDLKAWNVWVDAAEAIGQLGAIVESQPRSNWRIHFVAAVTLLRAIGHVVHKVDAENNPEVKRRLDALWPRMRTDKLFLWCEDARNKTIKLYELGVSQMVGWSWTGDARFPEDAADATEDGMLFIDDTAENAVDRLQLALGWWSKVLGDIQHDTKSTWPTANW